MTVFVSSCTNDFLACLFRSDEVVEVRTDELPENSDDILDILRAEMAPLSLWLRFAVEYYKQGKCIDTVYYISLKLLELTANVLTYCFCGNLTYRSSHFIASGNIDQFKNILQEATTPAADEFFKSATRDRIQILNSMAAFYLSQAKQEKDKAKRDQFFNLATQAYNKAERIDITDELIYAGKGTLRDSAHRISLVA